MAISILSGLWAVAMLGLLLWAIRLSYAIERREGITGWRGLPRYTNLFASAFGGKRSEQAEIVAMRVRLRRLLAALAAAFAGFAAFVFLTRSPGAG